MHFIPGMRLRLSEEVAEQAQAVGMDEWDMGEFAYDYVGLEQEITGDNEGMGVTTGGREPKHAHEVSQNSV